MTLTISKFFLKNTTHRIISIYISNLMNQLKHIKNRFQIIQRTLKIPITIKTRRQNNTFLRHNPLYIIHSQILPSQSNLNTILILIIQLNKQLPSTKPKSHTFFIASTSATLCVLKTGTKTLFL